jgi:hypothetical protein
MKPANVVRLTDHQRKPRLKSQYDLYLLPFFNAESRSTWAVQSTGNYTEDCQLGRRYAIEFLKTCDGTVGWSSLLQQIVADMIRAGPSGSWADGHPKINGIVIGFMGTIGCALTITLQSRLGPEIIAMLESRSA